ncbi:MAG: MFS transporter [Lentihominibacter sp.]|jgi:FLVCR family MFS transporter 7
MKKEGVSPYRWVILIVTIPIIMATEMMWLTFSPISSIVAEHYGVAGFAVDMLAASYMIMFIIFCIPSTYVIDRFGFRTSLVIGALLTGVFGLARAFFAGSFLLVIISQFLIAAGQPFLLNITTKAAANWFPFNERATADGLLTMAQYTGFAIPMALSPVLVEAIGIRSMLYVFAVVGIAAMVLVLLFVREKPKVAPPGPAAPKEDFSRKTFVRLAKNKQYVFCLVVAFVSMGIFNTILTLIESILLPRGITSAEAGTIGAVFVLAGIVGAVILPMFSDKTGIRIKLIFTVIVILTPLYLALTLVSSFIILIIAAGLGGFTIMGVAPVLFQHASETGYPVQEGTSLGSLILMGQISGVLFVFLFEAISIATETVIIPMLGLVILTGLQLPVIAKMEESKLNKKEDR